MCVYVRMCVCSRACTGVFSCIFQPVHPLNSPANQTSIGVEVVNERVFIIRDDDVSFGIDGHAEAELQLLILEGGD